MNRENGGVRSQKIINGWISGVQKQEIVINERISGVQKRETEECGISGVQTQETVMNRGISGVQFQETEMERSVVSSKLAHWPSY
jgi:hypothetical protein